ncbi:MAG: TonB-dependent receptor [Bacteroidetes bacterium]|nr:TonB-dependent receptor [Bacteroidota bacterium]
MPFKKIVFILFLLSFTELVFSQERQGPGGGDGPAIGKLRGVVIDNRSKVPIEFATIALYKLKDSSLATGIVAGIKGDFELKELPFGRYFMKVNFIGYKQLIIDSIAIWPRALEVDLGQIRLKTNTELLGEVEVTSEKSTIQLGIDRKIFNVDKNIVSEGGSATDVLQSIPSVSVDIDGNLSLRGSGNVTVLIDGKPSGITGTSRAAILQQIPASSIESIELITNPSAKYDPDGMSGIINIITKKNKLSGFNGSVTIGAGTNDKYNAAAAISYRNSKVNVYSNYGFRLNTRTGSGYSYRQNIFPDTTYFLNSESSQLSRNVSHNIKTGIEFFLNGKNTIGGSILYNTGKDRSAQVSDYTEADENNVLSGSYARDEISEDTPVNLDYNLNYRKTFAKPKQELVFDGTYSTSSGKEHEDYIERDYSLKYAPKNAYPLKQNTTTTSNNTIGTIQLDYVHPFKDQMKLEAGAKTTLRNIANDFVSESYNYGSSDFMADTNLSNNFKYTENIFAAYSTFTGTIKKFGYQLGLRAEQANTESYLVTTDEKYTNNYFKLFPSVHLSQKFNKEQEAQISYSRRINRPGMRSLNPFKDYGDPYNIRYGNPYLQPEFINSLELSYVKYWKKAVLTSTAYYRQTTGIIQRIKTIGDSTVSITSFVNLNSSTSYGLELIAKTDITKWWNTTISANVFETKIDGENVDADLQNNNFSYIFKVMSNMHLLKNLDIQFTANYNGPTATAQGEVKSIFAMDFGIKKEIFKNASLGLNITDLTNARRMAFEASGNNFYQTMERRRESRIATLTFTYRFGKLSETGKKGRQNKGGGEFEGGGGDMGM